MAAFRRDRQDRKDHLSIAFYRLVCNDLIGTGNRDGCRARFLCDHFLESSASCLYGILLGLRYVVEEIGYHFSVRVRYDCAGLIGTTA